MGSHLTWNFAHCVYFLALSSCLYKIYSINQVSTESLLLISAFYYIITWCNLHKNSWWSVDVLIRVWRWRHVKTINRPDGFLSHWPIESTITFLIYQWQIQRLCIWAFQREPSPKSFHMGWERKRIFTINKATFSYVNDTGGACINHE